MLKKLLNGAVSSGRGRFSSATAAADSMFGVAEHRVEKVVKGVFTGLLAVERLLPLLILGALFVVFTEAPALAQSPGGDIFGASNQTIGNGVRAFTRWFRVFIFFAGVIALGACGLMKIFKIPCAPVFWGSVFCFGFAGIAQFVYSISNGEEVEFNPDLG